MLAHLGRSSSAVESDGVNTEWFKCREGSGNFASHEHRAGRFNGHFDEKGQADAQLGTR